MLFTKKCDKIFRNKFVEGYMNKLSWGSMAIIIGSVLLSIELYIPNLIISINTFEFF